MKWAQSGMKRKKSKLTEQQDRHPQRTTTTTTTTMTTKSNGSNKQMPTGYQTHSGCKRTGPNQNWRDGKAWHWEWREGSDCGEEGCGWRGAWGTCPLSAPLAAEGYLTPPPGRGWGSWETATFNNSQSVGVHFSVLTSKAINEGVWLDAKRLSNVPPSTEYIFTHRPRLLRSPNQYHCSI